jgi:hypothetical protein
LNGVSNKSISIIILFCLFLASCSSKQTLESSLPSNQSDLTKGSNKIASATVPDFLKTSLQKISSDSVGGVLIGDSFWDIGETTINAYNISTQNKQEYAIEPGNYYTSISYDQDHIWFYYSQIFGASEVDNKVPLLRYDRADGTMHRYTDDFLGIGSNLGVHSDGITAWIVSETTTAVLDLKSNAIKYEEKLGKNARSIVGNDRYVWIGTLQNGVYELDKVSGQVTVYNKQSDLKDKFISELLLSDHFLLVNWGGEGGDAGLSVLDLANRQWSQYVGFVDGSGKLREEDVEEQLRGFNGIVWMDQLSNLWALRDAGEGKYRLVRRSIDSREWSAVPLPDMYVNAAEMIDEAHALIATDEGLLQINLKYDKYDYLLKAEGVSFERVYPLSSAEFLVTANDGLYRVTVLNDNSN